MIETFKAVIKEKKEGLERLEYNLRQYARADRLYRTQVNEISSLVKDIADALVIILDEVSKGQDTPKSEKELAGVK